MADDSRPASSKSDSSGNAAALQIVLPPSRTPSANSAESEGPAGSAPQPPISTDSSKESFPADTDAPTLEKVEDMKTLESSSVQKSGKIGNEKAKKSTKSKEKNAGGSQPPPLILMGPSGSSQPQSTTKRDTQQRHTGLTSQSSSVLLPPAGPFMLPPQFQPAYFPHQAGQQGHQTLIVNHYGQPVGIMSPILQGSSGFSGNSSTNSQNPTVSTSNGSNASLMPRGPIMYAYRSSAPSPTGTGGLMGNSILSGPSGPFGGFPSTGFPSNTVVIRTPVGQIMGFQVTAGGNIVSAPFLGPSGSGFMPSGPMQNIGFNPSPYQANTSSCSTTSINADSKNGSGTLPDFSRGIPIFPHPQYPPSSSGAPILPKPAFMPNLALGVPQQPILPGYGPPKAQPVSSNPKPKTSVDDDYAGKDSIADSAQLPKLEFSGEETVRKSSSSDLDSINVSDSPPPVINIGLDSKQVKDDNIMLLDRDTQSSEPPRLTPVDNESSAIITDPGTSGESQPFAMSFDKKWLKHEAKGLFFDRRVISDDIIDPHTLFMQEVEKNSASKPDILVHFLDGFIIHESSEPFPVSPFPFEDFFTSAMMELAAPPELELAVDQPSEIKESQIPPCAHCKRSTANHFYHRYPQFCSKSCWKKSTRESANVASQLSPVTAKRAKLELSPSKSDTSDRSKETEVSTESVNLAKSPSAFSPSSKSAISDTSLPCSSISTEPPVRQVPLAAVSRNPSEWTVDEVSAFLISLDPSVAAYAPKLRQQEIDGQALMLVHENHLMDSMGLKLGPALKLCAAVKDLKSGRL